MGLEIAKELEEDREHLQQIIVQCSERCLYQSAKWSAELLNSALDIPGVDDEESGDDSDLEMTNSQAELARRNRRNWHPIPAAISAISSNPRESVLETREYSRYLLAKSFFDCREYDRCSAVFLPELVGRGPPEAGIMLPPSSSTTTSPRKGKTRDSSLGNHLHQTRPVTRPKRRKRLSQKALFLALYAKYMSGEKRKDEDMEMILGPNDTGSATNPELHQVEQQLRRWREDDAASDGTIPHSEGWLEYLHGVVLAKLKNEDEAKTLLLNSIHIQPYNWGAWHELSTLMHSTEVLLQVMNSLPAVTTMCLSFYILTSQELFQSTPDIHSRLDYMLQRYPRSSWLQSQRALLLYHSREYVRAEQIFSSILHADPHRLDALDHYSNLLYVLPDRPKLAFIAQLATATDKFRPETCCVVGNYYSLTSQHEKAIAYFRRALTLDRACLSAWTLLGHEYVELKNSHAAIEAYRRAVDVNAKDYRAWYGLGQTYELLEMYYYSLWYFQRAAALRPRDATIWAAVGNCWARMERWAEAIAAQKRALICAAAATNINRPDGTVPGADADADADDDFEALLVGRLDPDLLFKIAGWYEKAGEPERCAGYMRQVLAQEQDEPELQADTASPSASSTRRPSTARPSFLIPSSQPQPHSQSQSQPQPSLATRRLRASSSSFGPGVAAATAGVLPSSSATAAAMRRSQIEPGMGMGMGAALRTSFLAAAEGSAPSSPLGAVERGPSMPMEARTSFMGAGGLPSSQIGASATSTAGAGAAAGTRRGTSIGSAMTTAVGAAELARGTGVTATTSKARMWLARWEMAAGRFGVAGVLARELCEDGWEIEEAKGMVRDCRARGEDAGGGGG